MTIVILSSTNLNTIVYELFFALSWMKDDELARQYLNEIRGAEHDFLALIKTTAFKDICGKVVGIRGCFGEYTAYVGQSA